MTNKYTECPHCKKIAYKATKECDYCGHYEPIGIVPLYVDTIYVDIFHNNNFVCSVNEFTELDIRRQICEKSLEGYSMKIAPQFMRLFDEEDNIKDFVVNIDSNGEVDNWFPEYYINDDYPSVPVFGGTLKAVLKIRKAQKDKIGNNLHM